MLNKNLSFGKIMFRSIQMLRALAVWLVVLHHVKQIVFSDAIGIPFIDQIAHKGAAGVDLFFIISGFIIYQSIYSRHISAQQFAINRIMRIVPAYWLFTGLVALLAVYFDGLMFATSTNPELLIRSLLFIPTERADIMGYIPFLTVGWTLNYEMFFYLLACLVILISRERFIVLISLVIIFSYEFLKPSLAQMPFYGNGMMLEFLLGIFIADFHKNGMLDRINPMILASLLLASMIFIYNRKEDHDILFIGIPCAIIVATAIGLEAQISESKVVKFIIRLGDYSYSTYLCHVIIICSLLYIFSDYKYCKYIVSALCVPFTIVTSYISYKYIERPIGSLSKVMLRKRTPAVA
ncbi:acyltransferase family protein [Enterobacter sp. SA187]|uniref:acyltransferase family protein n=1 Tax=Enterobacter sp. SA187 TaxID=1914861 RepID=UPI000932294F|nr:acyltransferase [Enterobacter sp. SA187]